MTVLLSLLAFARPLFAGLGSALQKPAVVVALAFALLLGGLMIEDHARTGAAVRTRAAEAALSAEKASEAIAARQDAATREAAAADASSQAVIQTNLDTLTQEVPRYVPASTDLKCVFPAGLVSLLDAGAAGVPLPAAPGVADDAPSAFRLSDLAVNALRNDAAKRANDVQLLDLQAWIRAQAAISGPVMKEEDRP